VSAEPAPARADAVELRLEPFDSTSARALLVALDDELDERYPGESFPAPVHDPADFAPPRGVFVVAYAGDEPVGCGAVKPGPHPGSGEVKRMYVVPSARGRRIAERVLERLAEEAVRLGWERLVLETGTGQPEALRLYERLGWQPVPAFGHYAASPLSRGYGRSLP
jgi:GNAT superfamily N-acetyltransferase